MRQAPKKSSKATACDSIWLLLCFDRRFRLLLPRVKAQRGECPIKAINAHLNKAIAALTVVLNKGFRDLGDTISLGNAGLLSAINLLPGALTNAIIGDNANKTTTLITAITTLGDNVTAALQSDNANQTLETTASITASQAVVLAALGNNTQNGNDDQTAALTPAFTTAILNAQLAITDDNANQTTAITDAIANQTTAITNAIANSQAAITDALGNCCNRTLAALGVLNSNLGIINLNIISLGNGTQTFNETLAPLPTDNDRASQLAWNTDLPVQQYQAASWSDSQALPLGQESDGR